MTARCAVTELPTTGCAHCRRLGAQYAARDDADNLLMAGQPRLGRWFTATYRGECANCDETIEEGDQIRADGHGGYLCADCGQDGHP
jgi:predicted RNA-binding Zn-ribbon protein involved in translation (DUF1610 family)